MSSSASLSPGHRWGPVQSTAFTKVKQELSKPTTLTLYDPSVSKKISADASAFGLGAVLLRKNESTWKAVAVAFRSMTETERRYAQVEKEVFVTAWTCKKFVGFI